MDFCVAETISGRIRGLNFSGVRQFKGVPYGASSAGPNRYGRPQRPTPWTGVRDCFGYGPVSPQVPSDLTNDYARLIQFDLNVAVGGMGEDCLHLNVWTPGTGGDDRRAVMFCIHGGGFAIGSGNHPMYDGAALAAFGDVVVVTVTHRLASFGFLNLTDLDPAGGWPDAGAAGLLDLVAALEWVRDNIANFGGDAGRVMIFGQSGGGWKVSSLLGMPAAKGLFHRAAVQSGSWLRHVSREDSVKVSTAFVSQLGISKDNLHALQKLPWSQLLAAQTAMGAHAFAPVLDGRHLPTHPFDGAAPVESAEVPLIVSTTLDDAGLFFSAFAMTEAELKGMLTGAYGKPGDAMLALYREYFPIKSPFLLHAQMITDSGFRRFAHAQSELKAAQGRAPVYAYQWEWVSPAYDGKFGAVHAMDVTASLRNTRDAIIGSGSRAAQLMCDRLAMAWVTFAKTGDPNNELLPTWPKFSSTDRATLVFDDDTRVVGDPQAAIRRFWLEMPAPQSVFG